MIMRGILTDAREACLSGHSGAEFRLHCVRERMIGGGPCAAALWYEDGVMVNEGRVEMRGRWFLAPAAVAALLASRLMAAQSAPPRLPYAAVHDPQFISASEATFMSDEDRVIGLMSGKAAKAYPAAILSQHGLVEDRSPKGPIAITW
jgi:hypothetical protein